MNNGPRENLFSCDPEGFKKLVTDVTLDLEFPKIPVGVTKKEFLYVSLWIVKKDAKRFCVI